MEGIHSHPVEKQVDRKATFPILPIQRIKCVPTMFTLLVRYKPEI